MSDMSEISSSAGFNSIRRTDMGKSSTTHIPQRLLDELDEQRTNRNKVPAPLVGPRYLADDKTREEFPLYDGLMAYFPGALCEVARWSRIGNIKHNGPHSPLHWAREKSIDHENKIMRHLLDARQLDENGFVEAVALAWRALALCQTILEERGYPEGANARRQHTKVST